MTSIKQHSTQVYNITPVPKPRQTKSQSKLPLSMQPNRVKQYYAFKDEVRLRRVKVPTCNFRVTFVVPMPVSWSNKKKRELDGNAKTSVPDLDNYLKALFDATHDNDSAIWCFAARKIWGTSGKIIIEDWSWE